MAKKKIYVGVFSKTTMRVSYERRVFRTIYNPPSRITNPEYAYVIGPFKTVRAAKWCVEHPFAMCQTVKEFEQAALVHQTQSELISAEINRLNKIIYP
jgi:hypothetical protein